MDIVIAGGHGQVARHLEKLLADAGHRVRALIRAAEQDEDVREAGAEPVLCDLEADDGSGMAEVIGGADAVVFAAGAGPGSGAERKRTVDYGAAVRLIDACRGAGVRRYVMLSSVGADNPDGGPEQMRPYLQAKADADAALQGSGLDWTIVRPGSLTNEPGTSGVTITTDMSVRGAIPREDVARVLAAALGNSRSIGKTFVVVGGETLVDQAIDAL